MEKYREIILKKIVEGFANQVPFHRFLGLSEACFDAENARIRFPMRDEFVGNPIHTILHGGIISSVLDTEGAFLLALDVMGRRKTPTAKDEVTGKGGTIDLRVDYLMPGKGEYFVASGSILRRGNKVSVIHTELHNDQNQLIAVGMATYMIG